MVAALFAGCGGDRDRVDLVIAAPRLFDGERLILDGAVAVRGGTIVAVGPQGDLGVDAERIIELDDATLLPGFVDLHVHRLGEGQFLSPVTTVRDLGSSDDVLPQPPALPGRPRVLVAGPLITAPGGYPIPVHGAEVAHVVRSPEEAREYVRSLAERGADVVKVSLQFGFPVVPDTVLRAIVAEADEHELRVTAHVRESRGSRLALRAGVDELAHMPCDPDPQLMRDLAAAGIEIVATLHVRQTGECADVLENAEVFVAAGGVLLYGSDYGNPGIPLGLDVVELELMAGAGLSRREVLANATGRAGELTGVAGLGRLAEGSPADVVGVRGDPTADLSRLRDPLLVVVRGRPVIVGGRVVLDR